MAASEYTPTKRCTKCGNVFPTTAEYFHSQKSGKFGVKGQCKACVRVAKAKYNSEHVEETRAYSVQYRAEHPEYNAKYYAAHAEKERARVAKYNAAHPEAHAASEHRRRACKRSLPDTFTGDEAIATLTYWQWKCAYCGVQLNQLSMFEDIKLHFDHYIPLSDPRRDNPGSVRGNMVPACHKCNLSKQNGDPIIWITRKFPHKAKKIIAAIESYFKAVQS